MFQSGISLCLTFHEGATLVTVRADLFQSGISLCLTFHRVQNRSYLEDHRGVSIRHQPVSDIPLIDIEPEWLWVLVFQSGISLCLTFHSRFFTGEGHDSHRFNQASACV